MRKKRRSRQEWAGIVGEWQQSRLSAEEFGRTRGINPARLQWWLAALARVGRKRGKQIDRPLEIVELGAVPKRQLRDERLAFEVVLSNGRRLSFSADVSPDRVSAFAAALESA